MHKQAAPWAAVFIFAALALAGCSGSGGGGGGESISIIPSDAGGGCYSFHAGVSLANYTWDLGDHYGVGYGADVEHCYTFKNGAVIVKLLNPADASHPFQQTLTIGSGQNQAPTMYLEADTNWAVLGEPVVFSASTSTDPDGDVLHYAWSCAKEAILVVPIGAHTHGNLFPYEPPAAGHVTVIHPFANHTLPAPTRSLDGASLCADSSKGSGYGTDSTVQVAINETGRYLVTVRGTDGVHPTISGTFQFYVTPQEWKPDPHPHHVFGGNITAPAPPQVPPDDLKTACEMLTSPVPPTACGYEQVSWNLTLPSEVGYMNVTCDAGQQNSNDVSWEVRRGTGPWDTQKFVASTAKACPTSGFVLYIADLSPDQYNFRITVHVGTNVRWHMDYAGVLRMDPYSTF